MLYSLMILSAYGQVGSTKVNLHYAKTSAADLMKDLARQSGYSISFNSVELGKENLQSVHYENTAASNVLKDLEKKSKLVFQVSGSHVSASIDPNKKIIRNEVKVQQLGRIAGSVVDDRGEILIGATIKLQPSGQATKTAVDGNFSFGQIKAGKYSIEVAYMGYQSKRITDVIVKDGELTKLDIVLNPQTNTVNQIVVTGTFKKESVAGLYARQKNSASMTDGISSEQISRTPDNNVAQVLGRVSGLNVQENKYVTVRGLSDRYNNVLLNGSQLPSTEPNKRNFAFDVIPTALIDNVIVHKTGTADLPGEFSGGIVQVETRAIPESNFLRIKLGTGFNSNATGKDFYQPQRGKYDFFAIDKIRDFKKEVNRSEYDALYYNHKPEDIARLNELLQKFPNRFKMFNYGGKPVQDYDISAGRVLNLKNGDRFGVIGGLTYRNQQTSNEYLDQLEKNQFFKYEGTEYSFSTNWSALLNMGYTFKQSKISLKNIYSRKLSENSILFHGKDLYGGQFVEGIANTPLINSIVQSRLDGEHKIGENGPFIKWHTSISHADRNEPDNKTHLGYSTDSIQYRYVWIQDALSFSSNYFSKFFDNRITWSLDADYPFQLFGSKQLLKTGYQGSYRAGKFEGQMYAIKGDINKFSGLPYYEAFSPENFEVDKLIYVPYIGNPNSQGKTNGYRGFQRLNSGYLMFDGQLTNNIRLIAGLRMEHNLTSNRSQQIQFKTGEMPIQKDSLVSINKYDWLPSATLIYALSKKTNIRVSYFASVARPDLRELSYFRYYDSPKRTYISGSDLKPTNIHNSDVRFEYYPSAGEVISVSGFYKRFINPIELQMRSLTGQNEKTAEMFYQNLEEASNLGFEVNFRKSLGFIKTESPVLNDLFLSGNFTWMKSKLKLGNEDILRGPSEGITLIIVAEQSRPLWGQAPYLINAGLLYAGDKLGVNLAYTRVGERIIYGSQDAPFNEWEKARDVIDAQVSYRFLKNNRAEFKLNASDLLAQPVIRYFNGYSETTTEPDSEGIKYRRTTVNHRTYNKEEDELRRRFSYGRNFSLSVSYTF